MKNVICQLTLLVSVFLLGCHHRSITAQQPGDAYQLLKGPEQCYLAVFQKDSAVLKFKTLPNGKIQGKLVIKYNELEPLAVEKDFYHGIIRGQFNKDTLLADYIFANGTKRTVYKNPIALLWKNNKLVLGFGVTVNYLGSTWFMDRKAINFTKSRFQFVAADCK